MPDERFRQHQTLDAGVSDSGKGTIAELNVAADLLSRGFEVFRALSPDCPSDLALLKDGRLLRVQATWGHKWKDRSSKEFVYHTYRAHKRFDVLALDIGQGEIFYEPNDPKEWGDVPPSIEKKRKLPYVRSAH
jgi:hypothetical protein